MSVPLACRPPLPLISLSTIELLLLYAKRFDKLELDVVWP